MGLCCSQRVMNKTFLQSHIPYITGLRTESSGSGQQRKGIADERRPRPMMWFDLKIEHPLRMKMTMQVCGKETKISWGLLQKHVIVTCRAKDRTKTCSKTKHGVVTKSKRESKSCNWLRSAMDQFRNVEIAIFVMCGETLQY